MRTETIKILQLDELSDEAKEKARDWWREAENADFGTDQFFLEPYTSAAKIFGIDLETRPVKLMGGKTRHDPVIWWSLHVPGSGASFAGTWTFAKDAVNTISKEFRDEKLNDIAVRLMAFESGLRLRNLGNGNAKIFTHGNEVHEYAMSVEVYDGEGDELDADDSETFLEIMRDFARWIHSGIEAEYDSRMEDEYIDDAIRANEYEFDEDGDRI